MKANERIKRRREIQTKAVYYYGEMIDKRSFDTNEEFYIF